MRKKVFNKLQAVSSTWKSAFEAGEVRVQLRQLKGADLPQIGADAVAVEKVRELLTASGGTGRGDSFENELREETSALHARNLLQLTSNVSCRRKDFSEYKHIQDTMNPNEYGRAALSTAYLRLYCLDLKKLPNESCITATMESVRSRLPLNGVVKTINGDSYDAQALSNVGLRSVES